MACFICLFDYFREKHDREMSALSSPVPVALQYLYGGSNVVQGEEYLAKQVDGLRFSIVNRGIYYGHPEKSFSPPPLKYFKFFPVFFADFFWLS